jgi:hypothetical protein
VVDIRLRRFGGNGGFNSSKSSYVDNMRAGKRKVLANLNPPNPPY